MENTIGEDMAALRICRELDLVDGDKLNRSIQGHRFDRADEPLRPGWDDFLLTGDERDGIATLEANNTVVIFAREQTQGEPDHAAGMADHPLDREMGLTGICGAENGCHPRAVIEHRHDRKNEPSATECK